MNSTAKTCTVLDYLSNMSDSSNMKVCLPACEVTDFSMNMRVSKFDWSGDTVLAGEQYSDSYEDAAILILYFETFYYDKITEYHESLTDFLCK